MIQSHLQDFLPQYHFLLLWCILEAFEHAGHLHQLLTALLRVSRCLVIDPFTEETRKFLLSFGFDPQLLSTWDSVKLQKELSKFAQKQHLSPKNPGTFTDFLTQPDFDKYDLIILVDWANYQPQLLPIYLRIRKFSKENEPRLFSQLYAINLFRIFDLQTPFWEQRAQQLKKYRGDSTIITKSSEMFATLCRKKREKDLLQQQNALLTEQIQSLATQIETWDDDVPPFHLEKHWQHQLLNRLQMLIYGHCLKWKPWQYPAEVKKREKN